jgi:hypothetical protein
MRRRLRYRGALRPEIGVYVNVEYIRWIWSFRATARVSGAGAL